MMIHDFFGMRSDRGWRLRSVVKMQTTVKSAASINSESLASKSVLTTSQDKSQHSQLTRFDFR
jgi:hypothetical protein